MCQEWPNPKTQPLLFEAPDQSIRIIVDDDCVDHWARYRQTRLWHRESGGLLFAPSVGAENGTVQITNVSGPNPGDRRSRYSLLLDYRQCLKDIGERFAEGLHFVGYWHTHPERHPSLSGIDRRAFAKNLHDGGLEIEKMIAIVVGNGTAPDAICVCIVEAKDILTLHSN